MAISIDNEVLLKIGLTVAIMIGFYAFFVLSLGAIEYMHKMLKEKFNLDLDYLLTRGTRVLLFIGIFYFIFTSF